MAKFVLCAIPLTTSMSNLDTSKSMQRLCNFLMFAFHTFHKVVLFPKEIFVITSLMKPQFVVTYTTGEAEIPTLLDRWVTNTPLCHNVMSTKKLRKCGSIRFVQVFPLSCKTVNRCVRTNCCFMRDT
jgi:hypothetical protein